MTAEKEWDLLEQFRYNTDMGLVGRPENREEREVFRRFKQCGFIKAVPFRPGWPFFWAWYEITDLGREVLQRPNTLEVG